jgi:hypothetical protein
VLAIVGGAIIWVVLWDAFESVVLPRRVTRKIRLTRLFYFVTWAFFGSLMRRIRTIKRREKWLSYYGPLSLLMLMLVWAVALVFAYGLASCAQKVLVTSREINQAREPARHPGSQVARYLAGVRARDGHARSICASSLRLKLASRIASIRHIANSLVFLGLIGTVIGFIIALSGVDAAAAADVSSIGPMVSTLITGMSIALHTTLVGAILNIWLMINYRLLEGGTVTLVTTIVELGERDAHP